MRPRDASLGHSTAHVAGRRDGVLALCAEDAIDPAVLVLRKSHVVDVDVGVLGLGHHQGTIQNRNPSTPLVLSATAKNDLRSASTRQTSTIFPFQAIAPALKTPLMPIRSII